MYMINIKLFYFIDISMIFLLVEYQYNADLFTK